jgi:NAD(P)-dependent dehydrogenase (short-subunit alcohol dehydrogenase family)
MGEEVEAAGPAPGKAEPTPSASPEPKKFVTATPAARRLAKELVKDNITVNAICPGIIGTQMWTMLRKDFAQPGKVKKIVGKEMSKLLFPRGCPKRKKTSPRG